MKRRDIDLYATNLSLVIIAINVGVLVYILTCNPLVHLPLFHSAYPLLPDGTPPPPLGTLAQVRQHLKHICVSYCSDPKDHDKTLCTFVYNTPWYVSFERPHSMISKNAVAFVIRPLGGQHIFLIRERFEPLPLWDKMHVMIHEATHFLLKTKDLAYQHDPQWQSLTVEEQQHNADSRALAFLDKCLQ